MRNWNINQVYILIFNIKTQRIYIGQTERLKERVLQHVKDLYQKRDNNRELQEEFSGDDNEYYLGVLHQLESVRHLDKWESIYYLAAVELVGREKVYNIQELKREEHRFDEIETAKDVIKDAYGRRPVPIQMIFRNFIHFTKKSIGKRKNYTSYLN